MKRSDDSKFDQDNIFGDQFDLLGDDKNDSPSEPKNPNNYKPDTKTSKGGSPGGGGSSNRRTFIYAAAAVAGTAAAGIGGSALLSGSEEPQATDEDRAEQQLEEEGMYTLELGGQDIEVDFAQLQEDVENSAVEMWAFENGDLMAYNTEVVTSTGGTPLYRFNAEDTPDPDRIDVRDEHPIAAFYDDGFDTDAVEIDGGALEQGVELIYGDADAQSEAKQISYEELETALTEGLDDGLAGTFDYFHDLTATEERGTPVYQKEVKQLLSDSLS